MSAHAQDTESRQRIEVIVRAIIVEADKILLCRNDRQGYFYLPGGHVEFGEPAAVALRRELLEESGRDVRVGALLAVSEAGFETGTARHHEVNLMFHVEHSGNQQGPVSSLEKGISFHWLSADELEQADVRPYSIKTWLLRTKLRPPPDRTEWIADIPT